MDDLPLTGAQKTFLRSLGQTRDPSLKAGKAGLTAEFFHELQHLLDTHELVKLRFLGADRDERAALVARVTDEAHCVCAGAVGHTALFYRQNPVPARRRITFA
jgi:RNA-binding protein